MATTHVFIVNSTTFKYHLEYMFVGTGSKTNFDFNNRENTRLKPKKENNLLGMLADSQRIRIGDYVIFYLLKNSREKISDGKFYGIFKIKENFSFFSEDNYLKEYLKKDLIFRAFIEPYKVYADGVTEWEALDEIKEIQSPYQMLWSLIYRKLRANRGNTMITLYESERLVKLICKKNDRLVLPGINFSFDKNTQKIISTESTKRYNGNKDIISILPRLINKYKKNRQFEAHLQTYILQNINNLNIFEQYNNIEWIGNEVACGVGMQKIDIMISIDDGDTKKIVPIELKSTCAYPEITNQIQRYLDWLKQYYIPNKISYDIEPVIISRKISNKTTTKYTTFINRLKFFNALNREISLKIRYVEFEIINDKIKFVEVNY